MKTALITGITGRDATLSYINVGRARLSIDELAQLLSQVIGYKERLEFDSNKPDGTLRKLLDISILETFEWHSNTSLKQGIFAAYSWYLSSKR